MNGYLKILGRVGVVVWGAQRRTRMNKGHKAAFVIYILHLNFSSGEFATSRLSHNQLCYYMGIATLITVL